MSSSARRSIYDRYQLQNSSAIPMYNGSNGQESIKVGQYMQGLYDQNLGTALSVNQADDGLQGHAADADVVSQTKQYYKDQLHKLATSGDWENMMPQTQQLAGAFARDAAAISAIGTQKAKWAEQLDDKDKNLTSDMKARLLAIADDEYSRSPLKLKRDGSGRLVGQYSGTGVDKNIDVNKKIDDAMKGAADHSGGTIREGSNGTWMVKNGVKWDRMTPAQIQNIIKPALANDEEFQGYTRMMAKVNAHGMDRYTDPSKVKDGPLKTNALDIAKASGIPFNVALKQAVQEFTPGHIMNTALSYGTNKYAKNNVFTDSGITGADAYKLKATKEGPDNTPVMIEDVDSQVTNDEKDHAKLEGNIGVAQKSIVDTDKEIAFYNKKLEGLSGDAKTQMESQRDDAMMRRAGLQGQVQRGKSIQDYARLKTAQKLGYTDYNEFLHKASDNLEPAVTAKFPKGLVNKQGVRLSPKDIAKAILDGRVATEYKTSPFGNVMSQGPIAKTIITTEDGKSVTLYPEHGAAGLGTLVTRAKEAKESKLNQFNTAFKETYKDNVENYAVKSTSFTLSDDDRKDITTALKGSKGGVDFYVPGTNTPISQGDKDDIKDFRVLTAGTPAPDGKSKFKVEVLDDKGKPTGDVFETHSTDNTRPILARALAKNKTPESQQLSRIMTPGSGFEALQPKSLGEGVPLSKKVAVDGKEISVKLIEMKADGGKPEWRLVDESGTTIKRTGNHGTAGDWYKTLQ